MTASLPDRNAYRTAIIGAGSIGIAFSIVFARAGKSVRLYDPDEGRRHAALGEITERLDELLRFDLIDQSRETVLANIEIVDSVAKAVADVDFVQECAPEQVPIKEDLFRQFGVHAPAKAILASSSSALTASAFASSLDIRDRCLVGHPGNPPFLIPVIEVVPAPFTDPLVTSAAMDFYAAVGLEPIRVDKEVEGFVFNRLQGAILREAYCLVRDGVASVSDVDTVVRRGLGLRWSFMGPFETVDLNTRGGIAAHATKMGPAYERMGAERGQHDPWTPELVNTVAAERRALVPLAAWDERVKWRDKQLMTLARDRRTGSGANPG